MLKIKDNYFRAFQKHIQTSIMQDSLGRNVQKHFSRQIIVNLIDPNMTQFSLDTICCILNHQIFTLRQTSSAHYRSFHFIFHGLPPFQRGFPLLRFPGVANLSAVKASLEFKISPGSQKCFYYFFSTLVSIFS